MTTPRCAVRPRARLGLLLISLLLGLAACAYQGDIEQPLAQRMQWFSLLNGDDIRAGCSPGSGDRYRLVYNGRWKEQLRIYDIELTGTGGGRLIAQVQGRTNLTRLTTADLLAPWRWDRVETDLDPDAAAAFTASLDQSGFLAPAPAGLRLDSRVFYWIAIACRDGEIHFHAWQHPSPEFDNLAFPEWLLAHDGTGVEINPPRKIDPGARLASRRGTPTVDFEMLVGENGLVDVVTVL